jgi:hemerythrin-like domain-containing protein
MQELVEEHKMGRNNVKNLVEAKEKYVQGNKDALKDIVANMEILVKFYPKHIEKEDKHFFLEVMDYFGDEEKEAMLYEYWEFDKKLIHEKYASIVEGIEKGVEQLDLPSCERAGTSEHARTFNEDKPCKEQDV